MLKLIGKKVFIIYAQKFCLSKPMVRSKVFKKTVLCLGQDFWGTQVSHYLSFRGTFTNFGGHTKSFKFLPVKLNSYLEISVNFL